MMYVLTAEEYSDLIERKSALDGKDRAELQTLCTKIANEMPVSTWRHEGRPEPWGCVLSIKREWYCDECPVQKICPHPHKEWSK